ncbi:MAG: sodium:calcium antiporter, partial [Chloroflexota bacterium]|nr:sodium:calcium antiporter [Chloroflexota bacterium]
MLWFKFFVCVVLILFFGTKLSRYGDIIAEKTRLGGVWVGLLLLAIVTSLPEIITGISAVTVVGGQRGVDLAMGTILGSNALNLFIIAGLDILCKPSPVLSIVGRSHILSSSLSVVLIAIAGGAILISINFWDGVMGWLSVYSLILVVLYLAGSRQIFRKDRYQPATGAEPGVLRYKGVDSRKGYAGFAISALVIIGAGIWLAIIGDEIVAVTGWGTTFVGSLLLAITTSLPELVVAISAIRIGSPDMAIADVLGSNMFNMGIGVFCYDAFYTGGSLFSAVSQSHVFTIGIVSLMTVIVIAGLVFRPRRKT